MASSIPTRVNACQRVANLLGHVSCSKHSPLLYILMSISYSSGSSFNLLLRKLQGLDFSRARPLRYHSNELEFCRCELRFSIMAEMRDEYGNPLRQTNEFGNPVGVQQTEQQPELRRSGSSSSVRSFTSFILHERGVSTYA